MNTPSVKTLLSLTGDIEKAKLVKFALTHSADEILESPNFPATREFERKCYNRPSDDHIMLVACDEALGTWGVEHCTGRGSRSLEYCNAGDAYKATLCFEFRRGIFGGRRLERVWIGCYGDWVEKWESKEYVEVGA
jgi:hypothetical protein